ncbi:MAG: cell division protein ZapE [Pseudohongiellaceae bacterium]
MLPSERYRQLQQESALRSDPLQLQAVLQLDALHQRITAPAPWYAPRKPLRGVYLWGSVGIGKSLITDIFFASLAPGIGKTRQHYQHFMARVHREMNALTGTANPLQHVGRKLAREYRVICLDELYITDLGDARILQNLLESLFNEGVALLITSNFAPDHLYKDQLQPAIFQPAIRLIKAHTEEVHLASSEDYRRLHAAEHPTWFTGDGQQLTALFDQLNLELQHSTAFTAESVAIHGHLLQPLRRHGQLAWFSFGELCERPRSARDYIALGQRFKHLLVSGVPQFGSSESAPQLTSGTEDALVAGARQQYSNSENAQRRFISLVDECYDQGIKLYLLGAVALDQLYAGGRLAFEFRRTLSRLAEMQTAVYRDRALRSESQPAGVPCEN